VIIWLDQAKAQDRSVAGGKASTLARLAARGFPVPIGFVIPVDANPTPEDLMAAAARLGSDQLAVRSSARAEDLAEASYAGLYESFLNVPLEEVGAMIERCRTAATADRVTDYRGHHHRESGIAVLIQPMVPAESAGVAFTASPITGAREETVVTAVAGLGESLVSGVAVGEEWIVSEGQALATRSSAVLNEAEALAVAGLARQVESLLEAPQDIEWAIAGGQVHLLQARPMTALPDPVTWTPPGPGLWVRSFRLGEWLPEPVTPLFADWLLPLLEEGFAAGMRETTGASVSFGSGVVNGWYYTRPNPPPARLPAALWRSRGRLLPFMVNALIRPGRNPAAADRDCDGLSVPELTRLVEDLGRIAGRHLWYLAVVGGAAWKMERHLAGLLNRLHLNVEAQALLRGLPDTDLSTPAHAVHSLDWFHPTAAADGVLQASMLDPARRGELHQQRLENEARCRERLASRPRDLARFTAAVHTAQKYAAIREQQARHLTLGWPLLRVCVLRLGANLARDGAITSPDDAFFLTRPELDHPGPHQTTADQRRAEWTRQRRLNAPLAIGTAPALIGPHLEHALGLRRPPEPDAMLTGQAASAGRATGLARVIDGPEDFDRVQPGDVLVTRATTPAWTPLFGRIAAVVTDGGTLAAHASLIAREYGIPAVVGTGMATTRIRDGEAITVDGSRGTVTAVAHSPSPTNFSDIR